MENEQTINELLDSLTKSIEEIHAHPTKIDRVPSNFEIMVNGVNSLSGIQALFSPKIDDLIFSLFDKIQTGDYEAILKNKDKIKAVSSAIFGPGSFEGPISNTVLNSIQNTMSSIKYNNLKSCLGKSMTQLKKIRMILKNLKNAGKMFKDDAEKYKQYMDAVAAIKQVLKFAAVIYKNRRIINGKVFKGLNNIVHEEIEIDETCTGMEEPV